MWNAEKLLHWEDNPLRTWRTVKEVMRRKIPLRVYLSESWSDYDMPRYAGYLIALSGNRYMLVKYGKANRYFSHVQLMGMVLSWRLWIDLHPEPMPPYYQRFLK